MNISFYYDSPETNIVQYIVENGGVNPDGLNNNGGSVPTNYSRTPFIPVRKGDAVTYNKLKTTSGLNIITIYDTNKSMVDGTIGTGAASPKTTVNIEQDGYIKICTSKSQLPDVATCVLKRSIKLETDLLQDDVSTLQDSVENIQSNVTSIQNNIVTAQGDITNINNTISSNEIKYYNRIGVNGFDIMPLFVTPGGINLSTGGDDNGSAAINGFKRTDFIYVHKGDLIKYYKIRSNIFALIAYYNENKVFQSAVEGTTSALSGTYSAPDDGYIRMVDRNTEIESVSTAVLYDSLSKSATKFEDIYSSLEEMTEDCLPNYWETYLSAKMEEIRSKDALVGNHGDSFIFITDTHVTRNRMYGTKVCKYIYKNSAVQKTIHGGDVLDINTGDTGITDSLSVLQSWQHAVNGLDELEVPGNHDLNNFNGSNTSNMLSISQWYGIMMRHVEKKCNTNGKTYYIYDNVSQKIRYIILDSEMDVYTDSLNFMTDKLTELESDWTALVIQHRYWDSAETVGTKGTQLQNTINSLYSNLNCNFAGVIVGHIHMDADAVDPVNGYPIIGVNCDAKDIKASGYTRNNETPNEQSFDVVHIDTQSRKIYMTRIGAGDTIVGSGTGVREYSY